MTNSKNQIKPNLDTNAKLIAEKRYLKTDKNGTPIETPSQMFRRVAKFIASGDLIKEDKNKNYKLPTKEELQKTEDAFYEIQAKLEFLSGMSLLDKGKEDLVAACYVLPINDSIESIYGTLANSVVLHRRGAGIGYDFSEIRPEGSIVKTTGKEASGPISFMKLYDFSSEVIMNRGAVRHAGHMGILRIDHPDILKFIRAKQDYSQLTNFNISISITDEFLQALYNNTNFELKHNGKVYDTISAHKILEEIAKSIHKSGEPGFIYVDEINRQNPTPNVGKMTSTNQCGEQPLLPYEACNLGSLVLNKFVINDKLDQDIKPEAKIDWDNLERVVNLAVHFLDNTITVSKHLLPEIEKIVKFGNRKIGIGVMGWADLLYLLEIPYNSDKALLLAEKVMDFINKVARKKSIELGKTRGSFGNFKGSKWDKEGFSYMRNATVTTIAPNGTTSLLAGCNGGIEPIFALAYVRKNMETMGDTEMIFLNKILESKLKSEWLYDKKTMQQIVQDGTLAEIPEIPERIKKVFVSSFDISPMWHIKMQGAFQKYTDNAVSKTINMPESATVSDIIDAFKMASKLKLKGLTIYRDKSRNQQVLNLNNKK